MRTLGLILAAAILPACNGEVARDDVRVTLRNDGTQDVRVVVEVERSFGDDIDREAIVTPSESIVYTFDGVDKLMVRVYRVSDNFAIYDDFWFADDLRRMHDDVFVTVSP